MQLNNTLNVAIGCITGAISLVTLAIGILSYREQRAQTKRSSGSHLLPIFHGQLSNSAMLSASLLHPTLWPTNHISYQSTVPIAAWSTSAVAHYGQGAINPPQISPNQAAIIANGTALSNINDIRGPARVAQNLASARRARPPTTPVTQTSSTAASHNSNGLHFDTRNHAIVQHAITPSSDTTAHSCFQINHIRPGQGVEASTSSRLPAHTDRRPNRRGRRYAEFP